jgi:hypothetical protein
MLRVCCCEERHGRTAQVGLKNSIHNVGVIECLQHGTECTGVLLCVELCEGGMEFGVRPTTIACAYDLFTAIGRNARVMVTFVFCANGTLPVAARDDIV